jgi:hypothetical protein
LLNFSSAITPNESLERSVREISDSIAKECIVPLPKFIGALFGALSKPTADRPLHRYLANNSVRRLVEMGIGDGQRAKTSIERMLKRRSADEVRYTGIDLFEGRPADQSGLALKDAHRMLSGLCEGVRLVPGDPGTALRRCANELRGTDLVLISHDQDLESLRASWHFLPRMLHNRSQVWLEQPTGEWEILHPADVQARTLARRAAA